LNIFPQIVQVWDVLLRPCQMLWHVFPQNMAFGCLFAGVNRMPQTGQLREVGFRLVLPRAAHAREQYSCLLLPHLGQNKSPHNLHGFILLRREIPAHL